MEIGVSTTVFQCKRPKQLEDWQSSVSSELVERAKKALVDNQHRFDRTANFIGLKEGDDKLSVQTEQSCHASMSSIGRRDVLATENGFRRRLSGRLEKEEARPFLKWFLYDSPYGFIILNRDDLEFCEDYGFVLAGDAPTTLVQCACIISRHFYEVYPGAFLQFNALVERGIDGFIAYQICFNSNISTLNRDFTLSSILFGPYGGHRVSESVTPGVMLNYYRGEVQNDLGGTYKERPSIYGSSALFIGDYTYGGTHGLARYRKNNTEFHNYLLEKEGKLVKSEVYRPPNPFVKKATGLGEHNFTCEQAVTVVADYCQQYLEEHLSK